MATTTKVTAADTRKTAESFGNKTRAIRETNQSDFLKCINDFVGILESENFDADICGFTENGLYKVTDTKPTDMTGVKKHEENGMIWYKVPTTTYATSFISYLQYRMTKRAKANQNALKQLASLSLEENLALLASLAK
jgi:hypothetical protein